VRDGGQKFVFRTAGLLRLVHCALGVGVELGVLDRDAGAPAELLRERDLRPIVGAFRFGVHQANRSEHARAQVDGGDEDRRHADLAEQGKPLGSPRSTGERFVLDVVPHFGGARLEHTRKESGLGRRRKLLEVVGEDAGLSVVRVSDGQAPHLGAVGDVNRAPVGEAGDEALGEMAEHLAPVERRAQCGGGLGQVLGLPLLLAFGSHVVPDGNRKLGLAVGSEHVARADEDPALGASLLRFQLQEGATRSLARKHDGSGQVMEGNGRAILAAELEPIAELGERGGEQLLGRAVAEHRRCGGIGEDDPAVRVLGHDAVGNVLEDDLESLAEAPIALLALADPPLGVLGRRPGRVLAHELPPLLLRFAASREIPGDLGEADVLAAHVVKCRERRVGPETCPVFTETPALVFGAAVPESCC
jgi:hypothetical protein